MVALKEPVATEFATVIYATLMLKQRLCDQGCGVGGKISDSDFPKFPTPTLQNVRLPATTFQKFQAPDSLNREWNLAVKINGNRGTQQETSVSKEIIPFQQESLIWSVM